MAAAGQKPAARLETVHDHVADQVARRPAERQPVELFVQAEAVARVDGPAKRAVRRAAGVQDSGTAGAHGVGQARSGRLRVRTTFRAGVRRGGGHRGRQRDRVVPHVRHAHTVVEVDAQRPAGGPHGSQRARHRGPVHQPNDRVSGRPGRRKLCV